PAPHARGRAIPTVTVRATTMGAQRGLLIRNAEGLEIAKDLHTVVFDKTGTLTRGEFGVSDVIALGGWSETDLLRIAAAVERNAEDVIAKAIVARSESQSLGRPDVFDFAAIPGKGARAKVERHEVPLGNQALLTDVGLEPPEEAERLASQGKSIVHIAVDGQVAGIIALADLIRDESQEAIADLKTMGSESQCSQEITGRRPHTPRGSSASRRSSRRSSLATRPPRSRGYRKRDSGSRWSETG